MPDNSSKQKVVWALLIVVVIAAAVIYYMGRPAPSSSAIAFAPYGENYASKPDFAGVEYRFPLTVEQRMSLTPEILKTYDQEQVDQIYARLTAGPIPDGPYNGDLFFPKGMSGTARIGEIAGALKDGDSAGLTGEARAKIADLEVKKLEMLGRTLWKGKVFYRDERVLRNRIDHLEDLASFFPDSDQAKLKELATPGTQPAPQDITVKGHKDQLYFPAKLYCGQSLLDSRRESVIIDYAFTDELPGYQAIPDKLAGRELLIVRDEIRMVRPGFYLGRAYMAGTFILNFTLVNDDAAKAGEQEFRKSNGLTEDCWIGLQRMAAGK